MQRQPAAVVERREAPGQIVDPGPAPGRHPRPRALLVGLPARGQLRRRPQACAIGCHAPRAEARQVGRAGHLGRHLRRGVDGALPVVELVLRQDGIAERVLDGRHHAVMRGLPRTGAPHLGALGRGQGQRAVGRLQQHVACPRLRGQHLVRDAVETVLAPMMRHPRAFVGLDEQLAQDVVRAHTHRHLAVVEMQADLLVVQLRHHDVRAGAQAHDGGTELKCRAAVLVGDHAVAGGQRLVAHQRHPGAFGVDRAGVARGLGDAADARWRIFLRMDSRHREGGGRESTGEQETTPATGFGTIVRVQGVHEDSTQDKGRETRRAAIARPSNRRARSSAFNRPRSDPCPGTARW